MFGEVIFCCDDRHELREAPVRPSEGYWERFILREQDFFNQESVTPLIKQRDYLLYNIIHILFTYLSEKALKNQLLRAVFKKALTSINKKVEISHVTYIISGINQPYGGQGMEDS